MPPTRRVVGTRQHIPSSRPSETSSTDFIDIHCNFHPCVLRVQAPRKERDE